MTKEIVFDDDLMTDGDRQGTSTSGSPDNGVVSKPLLNSPQTRDVIGQGFETSSDGEGPWYNGAGAEGEESISIVEGENSGFQAQRHGSGGQDFGRLTPKSNGLDPAEGPLFSNRIGDPIRTIR